MMKEVDPTRESVVITDELERRASRAPDFEAENRALSTLASAMSDSPDAVLQRLIEIAKELTNADSAGISLLEPGGAQGVFRWVATTGDWAPYRNGTMAREASPCGEVIAQEEILLLKDPHRAFPALLQAAPGIREGLLAPFHIEGKPIGTVWVIKHGAEDYFEAEDARRLKSLARFASAAHQMVLALASAEAGRRTDRAKVEAALRESEERQTFLLKLSDALRTEEGVEAVGNRAVGMIAERLDVDRLYLVTLSPGDDTVSVTHETRRQDLSPLRGSYRSSDFPSAIREIFERTIVYEDVRSDERLTDFDRASFRALDAVGFLAASLRREREAMIWAAGAVSTRPRCWTTAEVALFEDAIERTWEAVERARSDAARNESEERFRTLAESIDDVFYMTDLDRGSLLYLSPSFERVWGRSPVALIQNLDSFIDTIHPDDRPIVIAAKAEQHQGKPVATEYRIIRPDSTIRWIYDRCFPVPANGLKRSAGVASDITERKETEAALHDSEERFRQFGEAAQDVLWIRDAETFQWEYLTPAFETIYGLDREAALRGDNMAGWLDLVLPEDRQHASQSLSRVREGEWLTFEYRVRRPIDGQIRWLRNTDFPIQDASGKVIRIGGIGHDITDLKRAEEALAAAELRQRTLMEGIPQLVWRSGDNGLWTWASPQWSDYTSLPDDESIGLGWLQALHPDDRDTAMRAWGKAERRKVFEARYRIYHVREDRFRWFHTRASPLRDEAGQVIEWLGTSTDVDDMHRLQEQQGIMVAELQHRTRNLLAVVRSIASQTLDSAGTLGQFGDDFNDRLNALSRVQGLLSRSEAEPVTIGALIRQELDALGARLFGNRIKIEGVEVPLRKSSVQTLALALHELATNARKYGALATDHGRLLVRWQVRDENGSGRRLFLDWLEEGIDRSQEEKSPVRKGYGRELIERALPYSLEAKTSYELGETTVRCTIDMPLNCGRGEEE